MLESSQLQGPRNPAGLRFVLRGNFDQRQGLRHVRASANVTGTVGWGRRRSNGTVEVVSYREDGLDDFLNRCKHGYEDVQTTVIEESETLDAQSEQTFRIRREEFLLNDQTEQERYQALGVDVASRQFPALHTSGLLRSPDENAISEARHFWHNVWGTSIDTASHIAFHAVSGSPDSRVVPPAEYRLIWRFFNPGQNLLDAYSDKGLFGHLVPAERQPVTRLLCIDGRYYDRSANWIPDDAEVRQILQSGGDGIIKPTRSDNGRDVERLSRDNGERFLVGERSLTLRQLTRTYRRNFIVQEIVAQHNTLALPHPSSLNTLRVVTLRWRGNYHHLLTFARFGADGRINDNAGTGGLCVGVSDDGFLDDTAINERGEVHTKHPTSKVNFSDVPRIPEYEGVVEYAKGLHAAVPYFDLLSWDIAIGVDGAPVLIECNFRGAVWLYQLATKRPLFGSLTTDVLETIRHHRDRK